MKNTEKEILLIAQEECAEVTQAISKIFRFGYDSVWPENDVQDNRAKLQTEVGDLLAMIELMIENKIIDEALTQKACNAKKAKLKVWSNIFNENDCH
jgi:NTP pyrophosphatase (non-canonical NTP hydrolase)